MSNKFLENFQQYRMVQCKVLAIQDILQFYGLRAEHYLGAECIFYEYHIDGFNVPKFYRRTKNFSDDLRAHGFQVRDVWYTDHEEVWAYLLEMAKMDVPGLVLVDTFYIPHCPQYNSAHNIHYLNLLAYNSAEDVFIVNDPSYKLNRKEIAGEVLRMALEGSESLNTLYIFQPEESCDNTYENFIKMANFNVKNMLTPDRAEIYQNNTQLSIEKPYDEYRVGLQGIYQLSSEFESFKARESLTDCLHEMYSTVANLGEQTELHAKYLNYIGTLYGKAELSMMALELDYIAQNWSLAKNMFYKSSVKNSEEMLKRTFDKIRFIGELEEKYLEAMAQFIDYKS